MGFCVFQILCYILLALQHLWNLVPDLGVDPQGPWQGQAGPGAGNPAAHGAGDGTDDTIHLAQLFQAGSAEGVFAVEDPWDPVTACVLVAAHDTLEIFIAEHGDGEWTGTECVLSLDNLQQTTKRKSVKKQIFSTRKLNLKKSITTATALPQNKSTHQPFQNNTYFQD